ncbi:MAG: aminotransferase class V-fold PLP-dependent enzyme, partial [Candidatus Acidiferrales bacterium]
SVQWSSGYRVDLAALGALCRERNLWLVVDAIQQLGAVPIDVRATPIDLLACGGHKWLNAPFGCGFLYIRREALPRLRPPIAGYLSLAAPEGGWGNYFQTPSITPVRDYNFVGDARRYEIGGTANYPGATALAASLKLINSLGQQTIAEHIRALTDRLIAGLRALGLEIVTDFDREYRAGIVTFSAGSPPQNLALMESLLEQRILVSVRYTSGVGGIRVSCHFFNSLADVDRLLSALASLR